MVKDRTEIAGPHLVRYGIAADQKYLVDEFLETYDQLVINASMVAYMSAGLAFFITQRTKNKPYFIDPQTHAFQHGVEYLQSSSENSEGKIKKSIKVLIEGYGDPVKQIIDKNQSILPEDFENSKGRKGFCERVIKFQLETIAKKAQESENAEYWKFLKEKGIVADNSFKPSFVVAPYFYITGNTFSEWLKVNIDCAKDSKSIAENEKSALAVQIVISKDVLSNSEQIDELIKKYSTINKPAAFLIWIDSFSEQRASKEALKGFIKLAKGLRDSAPAINLYGGFFSVMLNHLGILAGVTHGLEYGEDRAVIPVGGGVPIAKFYLPTLHSRLLFRDAVRAVRQLDGMENIDKFHEQVCNCKLCQDVISKNPNEDFEKFGEEKPGRNGRQYPTPETKDNSVRHYMWCKQEEYKHKTNTPEILEQLKTSGERLKRVLGLENTEHCNKWAEVLSELDK